ncbi:rod shape-determining protein MreD [Tepidimonas charontis]|uniref:Rod shape-determining protein MreD n=1 Tax=Tepidimonas charontis TaxID=2267262 RepID=A0A554XDE0_9BURK|nr:rod shape-determining protein MreD [Tepidimonas charontis]TSE33847.1 Rod shape-determining protein MreD [Tepidimonas charontis]
MMLPRGQTLLLPANPAFVWGSLVAALAVQMAQGQLTAAPWLPDWMALTLVFWTIHQPLRIGVGVAFVAGLLVDVHQGVLLGQHALAYTIMGYLAVALHRRVPWFGLRGQTLHVLPLFLVATAVQALVRWLAGHGEPPLALALAPVLTALLWAPATWVLLAPQRRAPDPDETRPL